MKSNRLGRSGLVVSDICLGTMTFGSQTDEKEAFAVMDKAVEAGIDFFDAAEMYPVPPDAKYIGATEQIIGRWMKARGNRHDIILATKVAGPGHGWLKPPLRGGKTALDRHNIMSAVEGSLEKLQTDYIDLYQTHWPDPGFGYEETLTALEELVLSGKVRAIGCSNETAWGLTKSLWTSDMCGVPRYETIQNNFSLNNRRFEDELAQVCRQEGVSLIPYSPLAGGVLTGKYQNGALPEGARFTRYRNAGKRQQVMANRFVNSRALASTAAFAEIAAEAGMELTTLATAWSKQHDFVASTIIGVTTAAQLDPILAAADVTLSADVLKQIDAVSRDILYPMG